MQIDFFNKPGLDLKAEQRMLAQGYQNVVGLDEVGRGALAGPVVAAAVCLNHSFLSRSIPSSLKNVRDSKKLNSRQREEIAMAAKALDGISWAIGSVSGKIIDQTDILTATKKAMLRAVNKLPVHPSILIIDGNFKLPIDWPQIARPKADDQVFSVALASILAKVYRDQLMIRYARQFPGYLFEQHKGYATRQHYQAITRKGLCSIHRRSFRLTGTWQKA